MYGVCIKVKTVERIENWYTIIAAFSRPGGIDNTFNTNQTPTVSAIKAKRTAEIKLTFREAEKVFFRRSRLPNGISYARKREVAPAIAPPIKVKIETIPPTTW